MAGHPSFPYELSVIQLCTTLAHSTYTLPTSRESLIYGLMTMPINKSCVFVNMQVIWCIKCIVYKNIESYNTSTHKFWN